MLIRNNIILAAFLLFSISVKATQSQNIDLSAEEVQLPKSKVDRIPVLIDLSWQTNRSDPVKSLHYTEQAVEMARELGLRNEEAQSLNAQGVVYYYISEYDQALERFFNVLKIYQELNDERRMSSTYTNIGNCYEKLNAPDQALEYQKKALQLAEKIENQSLKASILNNIGNIYLQADEYEKARLFHKESLKLKKQLSDTIRIPYGYQNIGICLLRQHKHLQAISYLDSANADFERFQFLADQSNVMIDLARAYKELRDQKKAIAYLDTAIMLSRKIGNLNSEMLAYEALSKIFEATGETQKSYAHFKMYTAIKDSLFSEERERRIFELNTLYELENKNKNLAALQLKIAEEKQMKVSAFITGSFILILLLLAIYYIKLRNKNQVQKDQIAQFENEKQTRLIELKNRELMTSHLQQLQKKELLEKINAKIACLSREGNFTGDKKFKELKSMVRENLQFETGWDQLKLHFESVHPQFFKDLDKTFPTLTANEKRHCAYIKLNLNTKEISQLLNVSDKSVQMARYRMKKKMLIAPETELQQVINDLGKPVLV